MSTLAGDFWVCGDCRSINNAGARQCYNCRTPRDRAAVDPNTIDPSAKGPLRTIELPQFNPSRWAAMLATILIIAVAVMQVVQFNLSAQLINQVLAGTDPTDEQLSLRRQRRDPLVRDGAARADRLVVVAEPYRHVDARRWASGIRPPTA
jgi:hypothetical protein